MKMEPGLLGLKVELQPTGLHFLNQPREAGINVWKASQKGTQGIGTGGSRPNSSHIFRKRQDYDPRHPRRSKSGFQVGAWDRKQYPSVNREAGDGGQTKGQRAYFDTQNHFAASKSKLNQEDLWKWLVKF